MKVRSTLADWYELLPFMDGGPVSMTTAELDALWMSQGRSRGYRPSGQTELFGCRVVEVNAWPES